MTLTLRAVLRNVERHPRAEKYLTLRRANPFFAVVFRHPAAHLLLQQVGFAGAQVAGVGGETEAALCVTPGRVDLERLNEAILVLDKVDSLQCSIV